MSDDLRQQIYNSLDQKETAELFEIWQSNNRKEWTDVALEVVRQVLCERLNRQPPQQELENESPEEDADAGLNEENWPDFYDPVDVILLDRRLNRVAVAAVVITGIMNLLQLSDFQTTTSIMLHSTTPLASILAWLLALVWAFFNIVIEFIVVYIPLKALAYLLKILMEMEFDSRSTKITLQEIEDIFFGKHEQESLL